MLLRVPVCVFCHRRIESPSERDEFGPNIWCCARCRASAVENLSAARPAFTLILKWMNGQGFSYDTASWSIRLYDWTPGMSGWAYGQQYQTLGQTKSTAHYIGERRVRLDMEVSIRRGLPSTLFQGVCVHELTHAWVNLHDIIGLPKWANEGLAEFMCHRYYSSFPSIESRRQAHVIETNKDPNYGGGFRRVQAIVQQRGLQSVLESLTKTGSLPTGGQSGRLSR